MNRRKSKRINKKAYEISVDWLKSMLPEEEISKIKKPQKNNLIYDAKGTARSIPSSFRGAKRFIKNNCNNKNIEDITLKDIESGKN